MNRQRNGRFVNTAVAVLLAVVTVSPLTVLGADRDVNHQSKAGEAVTDISHAFSNGWRTGYIKSALLLDGHINPLVVDVKVTGNTATLTGYVDSDVDRSLAKEIALNTEGIDSVDNRLKVDREKSGREPEHEGVASKLSDAAITTKVKARLLANSNVPGMAIDVDTSNHQVSLSGTVDSDSVRELAYYIALNTDGVASVDNQLEVKSHRSG